MFTIPRKNKANVFLGSKMMIINYIFHNLYRLSKNGIL